MQFTSPEFNLNCDLKKKKANHPNVPGQGELGPRAKALWLKQICHV